MIPYESCMKMPDSERKRLIEDLIEEKEDFGGRVEKCADSFAVRFPNVELLRDCLCKEIERVTR